MNNSLRILVGVDGSPGSEAALRWALAEAALRTASSDDRAPASTVTALLAWTGDGLPAAVLRAAEQTEQGTLGAAAAEMLERTIKRVGEPAATLELRRLVVEGKATQALTVAARNYDLLVVGEHGHTPLHRRTAGSVSQGAVHYSPIPVVVARSDGKPAASTQRADRPVVVGVDGSDLSLGALRWGAHEAALRGAPLRVVHAWGGLDQMYTEALVTAQGALVRQAEDILDKAVALGLEGAADLSVDAVLSPESAVRALIRESCDAQLLVVGSRGLGGFARLLLGSVSHQCVLYAACDTAVVHTDGEAVPPAAAVSGAGLAAS
ncbi:universal stress protein [Frankia sp. AgB1.9]|uniref:universal stress protein n=1 Tax=unclassified Frankia TaxID=2632575 RepID=UPI0019334443|nr:MULTISPECIES: universal stress protein [unclassified Frankia]MBL7488010.1 universal stress protein [Frankia sp. AgW1.1]MBL7549448.1 universal stress protein [Frankia sp. AgB1.9]MBL7619936.1 universal stress protein [Frankia sp. AgB1.8]